ncbi:MAG TPA: hypothetical protein PLA41_00690 [Candidatus Pacearchaeota archaeon]|nr:hypothetical protein [Candidatus Parcubacteria bacterium]HOU45655.1 hypothetical protein [Candidatus Pacearchaeota archaeon]HPM08283.1 hypothetical protein [Candidatus Pacearchaeota archaeon]HQI74584.1 hypothetical protein [Candidatus Pacearchaeota archaeon]
MSNKLCLFARRNIGNYFFQEETYHRLITACPKNFQDQDDKWNLLARKFFDSEIDLQNLEFKSESKEEIANQIFAIRMIAESWVPEREIKYAIIAWIFYESLRQYPNI